MYICPSVCTGTKCCTIEVPKWYIQYYLLSLENKVKIERREQYESDLKSHQSERRKHRKHD